MGVANGLTADRMLAIEQSSVTGGSIDANGHLILETKSGQTMDAGQARGDAGQPGPPGPPGPPAPDTGFVSNLSFQAGIATWSLDAYTARKIGGLAVVNCMLTYLSGNPSITAGADANIPDQTNWLILPVGWQNASGMNVMVPIVQSGVATWWGRLSGSSGAVDLTHGW